MQIMIPDAFEPMLHEPGLSSQTPFGALVTLDLEDKMDHFRLDVLAMASLLRSLTFALRLRRVESALKENDAGPRASKMSPGDLTPYV